MSNRGMSEQMYIFIVENIGRIDADIESGTVTTIKGTNGTVCSSTGYLRVKINKKLLQVHQILAVIYFGKDCIGMQINHKDGNKLNNLKENLELVTREENISHQHKNGLATYRKGTPVKQLDKEGNYLNSYASINEASRLTGITYSNILSALRGYSYEGQKRYTAGGYKWEIIDI